MKNILITGAAGYIGSICAKRILEDGYSAIILDNLSTGHIETIEKLKQYGSLKFYKGDLRNIEDIELAFKDNDIDSVIHFAGLSQVEESEKYPMKYYENNVLGSVNLFNVMIKNNVKKIVFSSSAAIYGNPEIIPIKENQAQNPSNTYGMTKLITENMLCALDNRHNLKYAALRYFNASGASDDCMLGELHTPETHLIPNILKIQEVKIYGDDYSTKDGSCIRDYIDVEDLASAHILALKYLDKNNKSIECNLGSKQGVSVKEVVEICEKVTNKKIDYKIIQRRKGDIETLIADNSKAVKELNWHIKYTLENSIQKAYKFLQSEKQKLAAK